MNLKLFICVVIMIVTLLLRDVFIMPVPGLVIASITFLSLLFLDYYQSIPYLFFLFPLTCGIPGYIMLIALIMLFVKGGFKANQLFPVAIIAILEIISEGSGLDLNFSKMISFLSFVGVFFYFINLDSSNIHSIEQCLICFSLGVLFTFLVIFYNMLLLYGLDDILQGVVRSGALGVFDNDIDNMEGHLALNANSLAYYAVCASTALLISMPMMKSNRFIVLSLLIPIILLGFLSFSRTYILCLFLFGLSYCFSKGTIGKLGFIFILLVLFCFAVALFGNIVGTVFDSYNGRIESVSITNAGGRIQIFHMYNEKWATKLSYVVFGCGVVDYMKTLGMVRSLHCGIQQIWVCLGSIGLFLYIQQFWLYIKRYITKNSIILIIPFLISFIFDQSIQFLNPYSLMLPILAPLFVCRFASK